MILVIDDDIAVRTSLMLLFNDAGYKTLAAASQQEALDIIRTQQISLIILDLNFST